MKIEDKIEFRKLSSLCRGDILKMTTLAESGHPGGSMSMVDMLLSVYNFANISKDNYTDQDRDRIIVSNGHTSPGVYSVLGRYGFFNIDEAISYFRLAGSIFEGHIERTVPGIEWSTGNLGQGLSAACGFAVARRLLKKEFGIYVFMGDGEQQKGQIGEARRFAAKYGFSEITAFIDFNQLQISGDINKVMPQNIADNFLSDGWEVMHINGHDPDELHNSIIKAKTIEKPVAIIAHTVMGKGVSFMENRAVYHGKVLSYEQLEEALGELDLENDIEKYINLRKDFKYNKDSHKIYRHKNNVVAGSPNVYTVDVKMDNRSAFGSALYDTVAHNVTNDLSKIAVFDCDLASSVKTGKIWEDFSENFFESGIQEHHTATMAGAASISGIVSLFSDFGVFGVDEIYNQQRLNDINDTNLKIVTTHVGLDVGEDGKTHQCIDYIGTMRNLYGFKVILPADPNQTDRAVRHAMVNYGNYLIAMGRSKIPVISDAEGSPLFAKDYDFEYGKIDVVKDGDVPLLTYGTMLQRSLKVFDILRTKNIELAVLNVSCPFNIDKETLKRYLKKGIVFVYEDHNCNSGLGSIISNYICSNGLAAKVVTFGVTGYAYSGKPDDIYRLMGIDHASVALKIEKEIKNMTAISS